MTVDLRHDWRSAARCRDHSPEIWFPTHETHADQHPSVGEAIAIAVCNRCPVINSCLGWAMAAGEVKHGVIGGLRAADRAVLRQSDRQAA